MKLRVWFLLLTLLVGTILTLLVVQTFIPRAYLFYTVEALTIITIVYLYFFYRQVINPLRAIGNGMELLREQDFSSRLRRVHQQDADRIVEVFNRMIAQLKDERLHVRETNQLLDLLINASPMGVVIIDFDGAITSLNPAAQKFIACTADHAMGRKMTDVGTPLADRLATLGKDSAETFQMTDAHIFRCTRLSFADRGYAHPFFLIESLTDEVMKAEKKAYEKVIRMIAHEVNNTTAAVTSTLDSLSQALLPMPGTADLREVMAACIERTYSMSHFITRFADVVKIPEPQLQPCDISALADACLQVMQTRCAEQSINLRRCYAQPPLIASADAVLMQQVIANIIKNAAESIGHDGTITMTTAHHPDMLEIADNGPGISSEAAQKIFSPFFSTKPNGQGIGLVFIREVLARHQFRFSLKTYPDGITRFRIFF